MGVTQAAGLSLRWFRDTFGAAGADDGRDAYERLTEDADDIASVRARNFLGAISDGRAHAALRSECAGSV